jgi:probable F420-dependent oxidoreductase
MNEVLHHAAVKHRMLSAVLPFWFDRPPQEAIEIARAAEECGYDELWVGELTTFDAFALAGAIARETRRLRLVVGPLGVAVRGPVALALGIHSVALLGGRAADIALGASTPLIVEGWHGRSWQPTVSHLRETITALRPILAGKRSSFGGRHIRTSGFQLRDEVRPARVAVAAFAPAMVRAAAELADRVVLNLVTPQQVAAIRAALDVAAHAAGRAAPPLTVWVSAAVDPGPATRRQLAGQLAAYVGAPGYGEMFSAAGFAAIVNLARSGTVRRAELSEHIPPQLIEAVGAVGDRAIVQRKIVAFHAAGADTVALVPATADDPAGRQTLASAASLHVAVEPNS